MTDQQFNHHLSSIAPIFRALALKFTNNWQDAQDLQQETLLKAYKARENFQEGTNFKNWLLMIMRNTFINDYRKRKVRGNLSQPEEISSLSEWDQTHTYSSGEQQLFTEDIDRAIKRISPIYSLPFLLFCQGYEYQEIAEQLSIPMGTVKSRIWMARTRLKERLADQA